MDKHEKRRSHVEAGKTCRFIPPALKKHKQKRFIRILSLNVPEMRPLGTFWSILLNACHGNDNVRKISTSVLAMYFQVP